MAACERFYRQCATALGYALFFGGALILWAVVLPLIALLMRDKRQRRHYFRQTIGLSFRLFLHLLCFSLLPRKIHIYRFQFIQFHPGREPHFILFDCQDSHGVPSVFHPLLQPRKLFFG